MEKTMRWQESWDGFKNDLIREQWSKAGGAFGAWVVCMIGVAVSAAMGWRAGAGISGVIGSFALLACAKHLQGTLLGILIDLGLTLAAAGGALALLPVTSRDGSAWIGVVVLGLMSLYWGSKVRTQLGFRSSRIEAFEHRGRLYPRTKLLLAAKFILEKEGSVAIPAPRTAREELRALVGAERAGDSLLLCERCHDEQGATRSTAACSKCGSAEGVWLVGRA